MAYRPYMPGETYENYLRDAATFAGTPKYRKSYVLKQLRERDAEKAARIRTLVRRVENAKTKRLTNTTASVRHKESRQRRQKTRRIRPRK